MTANTISINNSAPLMIMPAIAPPDKPGNRKIVKRI